jgi:1-deoxy-D-xylulose-5-phosphate synthase
MAMGGLLPVVTIYSTFLTRAFDQLNLDVGLHELPVVFAIDRAGITGDDGPSHHGVLDMVLLSKVPGLTLMAPSSAQELEVMLREAVRITSGPVAVRWPKGAAREVDASEVGSGLRARRVQEGDGTVAILAVGPLLGAAIEAAEMLAADGVDATVWDVRVVKPLDGEMIADAARHHLVVTVEDGLREGGAGARIVDGMASLDGAGRPPVSLVLGVPPEYIPHGQIDQIHASLGLDGTGIAAATTKALSALDRI